MKIPHVPSAAFRLGAFATLAAVIVLIFPRYNNAFRFHYEIGKPWGYSTLTADFDFPIYKTDEQMERDQKQLLSTFAPIFKYIPRVQREVRVISLGVASSRRILAYHYRKRQISCVRHLHAQNSLHTLRL